MAHLITATLLSGGGPVGVATGAFCGSGDESVCAAAQAHTAAPPPPAELAPPPYDTVVGYEGAIELLTPASLGGGRGEGSNWPGQCAGSTTTSDAAARCPAGQPTPRPAVPADPAAPPATAARQRVRGGLVALATLPGGRGARDSLLLLTGDGRLVSAAWRVSGAAALGSPAGGRFVETGAVDLAGEDEDEGEDDASPRSPAPPAFLPSGSPGVADPPAARAHSALSAAARAPALVAVDGAGRAVAVAARSGAAWLLFRTEDGGGGSLPPSAAPSSLPPSHTSIPGLSAPTRYSGGPDGPLGAALALAFVPATGPASSGTPPTAVILSMSADGSGTAAIHLVWGRPAGHPPSLASRVILPAPGAAPAPDPVPYGMTLLPCGVAGPRRPAPAALLWHAGRAAVVGLDTGELLAAADLPLARAPTRVTGRRDVPVAGDWCGDDGRSVVLSLLSGRLVGLAVENDSGALRLALAPCALAPAATAAGVGGGPAPPPPPPLPPAAVLARLPDGRLLHLPHVGGASVLVQKDGRWAAAPGPAGGQPILSAAAAVERAPASSGAALLAACPGSVIAVCSARPVDALAATAPGTAPGVTGLWSVEVAGEQGDPAPRSAAVVSFAAASRALVVGPDAALMDATATLGLEDGESTLAFGTTGGAGGWVGVQVTPVRVRALSRPPPRHPADWTPPPGVTIGAAAVFTGGVLVSTSDARGVALLLVGGPGEPPAPAARLGLEAEVSCLHAAAAAAPHFPEDGRHHHHRGPTFLALAGTYASSVVLLAARPWAVGGGGGEASAPPALERLATLTPPPPRAVPWAWEGPCAVVAAAAAAAGGGYAGGSGAAGLASGPPPPPPDVPESVLLVVVEDGGDGQSTTAAHALVGWRSGSLAHAAVTHSPDGGMWGLAPVTSARLGGLPLTIREVGGGGGKTGAPATAALAARAVVAGDRAALVALPPAGVPAGMVLDRLALPAGTAHAAAVAVPGSGAALLTADRGGACLRVFGLEPPGRPAANHHPRSRLVSPLASAPTHVAPLPAGTGAVVVALAADGGRPARVEVVPSGGAEAAPPLCASFHLHAGERVTALRPWSDLDPGLGVRLAAAAARARAAAAREAGEEEGEGEEEEVGGGARGPETDDGAAMEVEAAPGAGCGLGAVAGAYGGGLASAHAQPRPPHGPPAGSAAVLVGTSIYPPEAGDAAGTTDDGDDAPPPSGGRLLVLWLSGGDTSRPKLTLAVAGGVPSGVAAAAPLSPTAVAVAAGARLATVALTGDGAPRWARLDWRALLRRPAGLEAAPFLVKRGGSGGEGEEEGDAAVAVFDAVTGAALFTLPPAPPRPPDPGAAAAGAAAAAFGGGLRVPGHFPGGARLLADRQLHARVVRGGGGLPARPPVRLAGINRDARPVTAAVPAAWPLTGMRPPAVPDAASPDEPGRWCLGAVVGDEDGRLTVLAPARPPPAGGAAAPAAARPGRFAPPPSACTTPELNMAVAAEASLGAGAVTALVAVGRGGAGDHPPAWTATTASGAVVSLRPLSPPHYAVLAGVQAALEAGVPGLAPLGSATATAAGRAAAARARARRGGTATGASTPPPPASPPAGAAYLPGMSPPPAWPVGPPAAAAQQAVGPALFAPPPGAPVQPAPPRLPILDGDTLAALLSIPEPHRAGLLAGARVPSGAVAGSAARAAAAVEAACPLAAAAAVEAALGGF